MRVVLLCLAWLTLGVRGSSAVEGKPGSLQVLLLPTIQYAHEDVWTRTPSERGPQFAGVGQVVREQPVHLLVSANQFGIGADGLAEVNYHVTFIRPDGTAGSHTGELKLIARATGLDPRYIHRAAEQIVFTAGPSDPLGTWRVVVEATDASSGATVRTEQPLTVRGDELLQEPLPPGTDQGRWLTGYHDKPVPQQLFATLKDVAEHPPANAKPTRDADNGVWLGFFEQVLTDNPWMLPHLVARLEQVRGRESELLATSLAYAKREELSFFKTLPNKARDAFMPHRLHPWPTPTAEPLNGRQLDVLWGRFFASGRYAPIRELVGVLSYYPYREAFDEFKKQEKKPAQPPVEVQKGIVFGAAVWSLRSNIQQDQVVRDYCEGILLRKELAPAEHNWLLGIFKAGVKDLPQVSPTQ